MLGFKRQTLDNCPDRSDHRKLSKDDAFSIYESTLRKLGCDQRLSWWTANSSPKIVPQAAAPALRCSCYPSTSAASVLPAHFANGSVHGQPVLANSEAESHSVAAPDDDSACFHCRRNICPSCYRWCAGCQEKFCSICSLMDFSERDDRAFCLDCYGSKRTCSK